MKSNVVLIGLLIQFFCTSVFAQQFSTLGEIYNFDPGDEFQHIEYNCCNDVFFQLHLIKIVERNDEQGAIQYIRNTGLLSFVNANPPILTDTIHFNLIDTLYIRSPDSIIFKEDDEVISNAYIYNRRKICIKHSSVLGKPKIDKYVDGCGLAVTSWYISGDSGYRTSDSLVYYKKGLEKWGESHFQTNIRDKTKYGILLYPNPVHNTLQIKCPDQSQGISLTIYDLYGKLILSGERLQNKETFRLDLSHFKKGVYLLHFKDVDNKQTYRIIKH